MLPGGSEVEYIGMVSGRASTLTSLGRVLGVWDVMGWVEACASVPVWGGLGASNPDHACSCVWLVKVGVKWEGGRVSWVPVGCWILELGVVATESRILLLSWRSGEKVEQTTIGEENSRARLERDGA